MADRRILTTHTGSLPRPDDLIQIMWAKGDGIPVDEAALSARVASAVQEIVDKQVAYVVVLVEESPEMEQDFRTFYEVARGIGVAADRPRDRRDPDHPERRCRARCRDGRRSSLR